MTFAASFVGFACGGKFTVCPFLVDSSFILPWPQFCNGINACLRELEARILLLQALSVCEEGNCVAMADCRENGAEGLGWARKAGRKAKQRNWQVKAKFFNALSLNKIRFQEQHFIGSISQWGSLQKRLKPAQKSSFILGCHFLNTAHVCSRPTTTGSGLGVGF